MKKTAKFSFRVGLAAIAAATLAFGAASPAFAADMQLGPGDIGNYQNGDETSSTYNYDTWHIGSNSNPDLALEGSIAFEECAVTMLAHVDVANGRWVQILKGFPLDGRPTAAGFTNVDEIQAWLQSTSIEVLTGDVTIQLPFFEFAPGNTTPNFTTVRSVLLSPGTYNLADLELHDSMNWFSGGSMTLSDFLAQMQIYVGSGTGYELLGIGFNGSEGAQVSSLSFGGNQYSFRTGSCAPIGPKPPVKVDTAAK